MLPHGTRCAAIARATMDSTLAPRPTNAIVRATFHSTSRLNARYAK